MTRSKTLRGSGALAAFLAPALLIGASRPASAQCADLPGCVLVWSDEFGGTEVDRSKWSFQLGEGTEVGLPRGWGNRELQYYRAENATLENGLLVITAREESAGGLNYTSARLRSLGKGDWAFGRMEMRARMPIGAGLWPALWMLPSGSPYGGWAAGGEIDILEYVGSAPTRIRSTGFSNRRFSRSFNSGWIWRTKSWMDPTSRCIARRATTIWRRWTKSFVLPDAWYSSKGRSRPLTRTTK